MSNCLYAGGTEESEVNTSCSMILRSVCQHPRTRTSSSTAENTCHECHTQNYKEDISNGTKLNSTTIKSKIENYSLTQSKSITFSESKTLSSELKFASLKHSSQNSYLRKGERCNTILTESTNNNLSEKIGAMSRTRSSRSSVSSIRALSGSDTEYDENENSSFHTLQHRAKSHSTNFSSNLTGGQSRSVKSKSSSHHSNSSSYSNEMSQEHSESIAEWLRWLVWRKHYLKILKVLEIDIRILTCISSYGKKKICFLALLLPIILWLGYGYVAQSSSYISFSSGVCVPDELDQEQLTETCGEPYDFDFSIFAKVHEIFGGMLIFIQSYFNKKEENSSSESASNTHHPVPPYRFHKDDVKELSQEVFKLINEKKRQGETDSSQQRDSQDQYVKAELLLLRSEFKHLSDKILEMEDKINGIEQLILLLKSCCSKKLNVTDFNTEFKTHLISALRNITGESDSSSIASYGFFHKWINSKSVNKAEIQSAFDMLRKDSGLVDEEAFKKVQKLFENQMETIKADLSKIRSFSSSNKMHSGEFSFEDIKKVINEAIQLYDSDKNGLVDYALESGGGSVLGTRCSETYLERNARFSVFGFPLWYSSNSPRTAIQPAFHPGDCWPFKGTQGFLVIQLSANILITGFSLEHIPVNLSPTGNIDSAPKEFSVWGLMSEKDSDGSIIGKYTYNKDGQPLQYFEAQDSKGKYFSFVELKIHSNNGNPDYTCIYRFRVHGTRK